MPKFTVNLNISNKGTRNEVRTRVIEEFLKEKPGTGKGDKATRYTYYIEELSNGDRVFLERPAWNARGFDFVIHVENTKFSNNKTNPTHDDILVDLKNKKSENPEGYKNLYSIIEKVFNCEEIRKDIETIESININSGYPLDLVLYVLKWFFIEQDIRFWNYSGRNMLMSGIPKP